MGALRTGRSRRSDLRRRRAARQVAAHGVLGRLTFRRELLRALNRGEAVNALKRAIYAGRVTLAQGKRVDEMRAVADALSLLANIVMVWNTTRMHTVLDRWANRRQIVRPELTGRIAPTRLEGINLLGVFRLPVQRYADRLLPSKTAPRTSFAV